MGVEIGFMFMESELRARQNILSSPSYTAASTLALGALSTRYLLNQK